MSANELQNIEGPTPLVVPRVITIEAPKRRWPALGLRELWQYRELMYFLTWRDVKVRYKQTVLGASWAVIQPLLTMLIFSLFFGKLANIPSEGVPYPIFSFAALVPWTFFATGLGTAAGSLISDSSLVTKVYFPRLIVPISAVMSGIVDFLLSFAVLIVMMFIYGFPPTINALWLPLFFLLAFITALGVGSGLAALNAKYRDIRYTVAFLIQAWLFLTPVAYPSSLLPEPWRTLYGLNPMATVVEGFRWGLLGTESAPGLMALVSSIAGLLALIGGAYYFRKQEGLFADLV